MTIREAQAEGSGILDRARVDEPSLDASLLLAYAVGLDRSRLIARYSEAIEPSGLSRYRNFIARRADGDCVAYIVGMKEFRGLDFIVTPDVLVPRPDTETLVEAALEWIDERANGGHRGPFSVLDVCAGSGCVAIALKAERPDISVSASELSDSAMAIARRNADRLLKPKFGGACIDFFLGDLTAPVPGPFDLIVSNPPYVPSEIIDGLSVEVRKEPRMALDGGNDGLDLIRRLVPESYQKLRSGGRLLVEAGHDQSAAVARLMGAAGFIDTASYRDLAGIERVTGGSRP